MDGLLKVILSNNLIIILAGALGGILGLLASYKSIGKLIRMARTTTTEIGASSSDAQVEIVGNADGEVVLSSPITKTTCVLWQVAVSERRSSGKSSHWVTVYSQTSTAPFDVYDVTGRIRVYPGQQMELVLQEDVRKSSGLFHALDEPTQMALQELGVDTKGFFNLNKALRVQECYVEKGDQIYVLGSTSIKNGVKAIDGESPLIVSDQSELRLLGRFLWRVLLNTCIGIFLGMILALYVINL